MKLIIQKEKILNAVLVAERLVGKKESLPILSCILLDAGSNLSVRATNLEAGVDVVLPVVAEEKGVVAVPAVILSQTLKSIRSEKIEIKTSGGNLVIESQGTKTLIKAVPHDEFPLISSAGEGKDAVSMSREGLLRGIQSVLYSASPSMIRPELGSVYISIKRDEVVFAATDSFRLAEKITKSAAKRDDGDILVPLKHAGELVYVLERIQEEEVALSADDAQLVVSAGSIRFVSRVVAAAFPNYREIMPKAHSTEATVLKNDFAEMLRKARVFSGNDQNVGLHLYPKRKIFSATAQSADVGEMSDSIDAALSGEDIDINFHIGYLSDCLPSIISDSIVLGFSGAGKPLVIKGISDPGFTYLVMPLNR